MFGFGKNSSVDQDLQDHFAQRLHRVRSEKIDDTFYWYDADTDQFITQGQTDAEIRTGLQQNWTDHIFIISRQHMIMGPDFDQLIDFEEGVAHV